MVMVAQVELKALRDVWRRFPSEDHARRYLERLIWPTGRYCPHCGCVGGTPISGRTTRAGLYQCNERGCRRQFTVTTHTPMHATKLDLRTWLAAMFLAVTSSKGISSVVMARLLGVTQKTAWKLGHAIRRLMDESDGPWPKLSGIVEVDEKYVGGAPKYQYGVKNKRGHGTKKIPVFLAVSRDGQARACLTPGMGPAALEPLVERFVEKCAILMSDGSSAYTEIGKSFADHQSVLHGKKIFAKDDGKVHINTAESFGGQIERAMVGVWHGVAPKHLQRYLDEILFRWNNRQPREAVRSKKASSGDLVRKRKLVWEAKPADDMIAILLRAAIGRQVRRTKEFGLWWVPQRFILEPDPDCPF